MPLETSTTFILQSIEGSASRGGWQASGNFANDQEEVEWGRHVELFNLSEGGGAWELFNKLTLSGSMLPQTLRFNRRQSQTALTVATSDTFLVNAGVQGIYFVNAAVPTNIHQIIDLNLGKIIEHIVEQHTNISTGTPGGWVDTSGIDTLNSTTVEVFTVKQSNSIWSSIQSIADNEFYVRYFTKEDELIYEQHPQFKPLPLPPVTLTLNATNIVGEPDISFRDDVQVDQVQLYALTDEGLILQAFNPTNIGTEGRRLKFTNLRCNSQSRLDTLADRAFKFNNREFNVRVQIAGPWGTYLELYDRIAITYSGTTRNGVTIDWTDKKFWIDNIRINRVGSFAALTELTLEEENI